MSPLDGFKLNGGSLAHTHGLIARVIEKLVTLPDDDLWNTRAVVKAVGSTMSTFSKIQADPAFEPYHVKYQSKSWWGNPKAIVNAKRAIAGLPPLEPEPPAPVEVATEESKEVSSVQ